MSGDGLKVNKQNNKRAWRWEICVKSLSDSEIFTQ